MKLDHKKLLLATVSYADIFDWPLTQEELSEWAIKKSITKKTFQLPPQIRSLSTPGETYFFLNRRRHLVKKRTKRESWAKQKWEIARRVAKVLQIIPSLILVGVTGGLSRNNVGEQDDIDLFCITASGTLWISRFLIIVIVSILGLRRRPGDEIVKDKICLNMFMSEDTLSLSTRERDLFAAYEVLQMRPLWERSGSYRKFLSANAWTKKFLPNAWRIKSQPQSGLFISEHNDQQGKRFLLDIGIWILRFAELPSWVIQLWYMRRRRTSEVISPGVLRFHPRDARIWIKRAFERRFSHYNLPLDKIFYSS